MSTVRFLACIIRYCPWWYTFYTVLWLLVYLIVIASGWIMKQFFDLLTGNNAYGLSLQALVVLLITVAVVRSLLFFGGLYADANLRFRMDSLLRRNMLAHIVKEPGARAIPHSPGEAISNFRDDVEVIDEAISWSIDMFSAVMFAMVSFVILFHIHAVLAMTVFLPLIVIVTTAQLSTVLLQKYRAASREATSLVTGAISEMFSSVQSIQVACAENRVIERFSRLSDTRRIAILKDKVLGQALDSVFSNTINIGTGLILLFAGQALQNGSFTVGDFALFVYYLTFVTQFIQNVGRFIRLFKQSAVSKQRLAGMLQGAPLTKLTERHYSFWHKDDQKPPQMTATFNIGDTEKGSLPAELLNVKQLCFRYNKTGRGIDDITMRLTIGSFTVITGRIGSGKTTLLRTLLGLLPKQQGEVYWRGEYVHDAANFFVPPHSAYTPQVPKLYSETLRNNIALGDNIEEHQIQEALYISALDEDVERLEWGLDTVIGPRGVKLSGGQQQRTAAARMLVRDADLLVFDDLSSALDVDTEIKLWARLFARQRRHEHEPGFVMADKLQTSYLVVSHRRTVLAHADRIIVLKDGRIEVEGTVTTLLQSSTEFQYLWNHLDN